MNRKKKKPNKYDVLVDKLANEFSKINNFHLTQEDEKGRAIFNFTTYRIAELSSYRTLFLDYYTSAASKAIINEKKEMKHSKYRAFFSFTDEQLKENYYDTIRLGYVGLYHKYENYIEELIEKAVLLIQDEEDPKLEKADLIKHSNVFYNFKIKSPKINNHLHFINWICNCFKHNDGYPNFDMIPNLDGIEKIFNEKQKIVVTKNDFKRDSQFMIDFYTIILQLVFAIAMHKMMHDMNHDEDSSLLEDKELKRKGDQLLENYSRAIKKLIKLIQKNGVEHAAIT